MVLTVPSSAVFPLVSSEEEFCGTWPFLICLIVLSIFAVTKFFVITQGPWLLRSVHLAIDGIWVRLPWLIFFIIIIVFLLLVVRALAQGQNIGLKKWKKNLFFTVSHSRYKIQHIGGRWRAFMTYLTNDNAKIVRVDNSMSLDLALV